MPLGEGCVVMKARAFVCGASIGSWAVADSVYCTGPAGDVDEGGVPPQDKYGEAIGGPREHGVAVRHVHEQDVRLGAMQVWIAPAYLGRGLEVVPRDSLRRCTRIEKVCRTFGDR